MDDADVEAVARLHVACLPDSLVTTLGLGYARSFYRYVTRSSREVIVTERDGSGRIVAAAVVTLDPASFNRRLALRTSLLLSLMTNATAMVALWWSSRRAPLATRSVRGVLSGAEATPTDAALPEMILIFTARDARRQGRAAALVRSAERRLATLGIAEYQVRTVLDPSNRALDFYRDLKFVPSGTSVRLGTRFQRFTKRVDICS